MHAVGLRKHPSQESFLARNFDKFWSRSYNICCYNFIFSIQLAAAYMYVHDHELNCASLFPSLMLLDLIWIIMCFGCKGCHDLESLIMISLMLESNLQLNLVRLLFVTFWLL